MNSVYIKSAPFCLQTALKGGSLTSSIGASNNGKSPNSKFPILTTSYFKFGRKFTSIMEIYETDTEIAKRKNWLLSLIVIVLVGLGILVVLQVSAVAIAPFLFD